MLASWLQASRNSLDGFAHALRNERPVRQEAIVLAAALLVVPFVAEDWRHGSTLIGVLLLVIAIELLNNGIEAVCDLVSPERHPLVKIAKDSGSAAVTIAIVIALMFWVEAVWSAFVGGQF